MKIYSIRFKSLYDNMGQYYVITEYWLIDNSSLSKRDVNELITDGYKYQPNVGLSFPSVLINLSFEPNLLAGFSPGHYDKYSDALLDCIKKDKLKEFLK